MSTASTPTLETFTAAVSEMREQQRLYFSTRDNAALMASKRLERKVDGMLVELAGMPLFQTARSTLATEPDR